MQGMNFSNPASNQPAAIPQMGGTAPPLPSRPPMSFNQPPPPPPSSLSSSSSPSIGNSNNSSSFNSYGTQQGGGLSAYEQWRQSRQQSQPQQQQQQSPGPKPIRFSLQPKRPQGKNQFNSNNNNPNLEPLGTPKNSSISSQAFGSNVNSHLYDEEGPMLPKGTVSNVNSQGYSGSSSQSWSSGYSGAGDSKRTPLLPTPLLSKQKNNALTQQQIINAMDPSDWPPSLQ